MAATQLQESELLTILLFLAISDLSSAIILLTPLGSCIATSRGLEMLSCPIGTHSKSSNTQYHSSRPQYNSGHNKMWRLQRTEVSIWHMEWMDDVEV
jgi:hypothetical protein